MEGEANPLPRETDWRMEDGCNIIGDLYTNDG